MKGRLVLVIAWLIGVVAVLIGGMLPDGYREDALHLSGPQPYPLDGVAMFILIATVECALLWAVIRPKSYDASWGRVLVALMLFVAATMYFGMWLMHAPPYMSMHVLWLVFMSLALLVVGVFSFARAIANRLGA